jgi:hypothetical protein
MGGSRPAPGQGAFSQTTVWHSSWRHTTEHVPQALSIPADLSLLRAATNRVDAGATESGRHDGGHARGRN